MLMITPVTRSSGLLSTGCSNGSGSEAPAMEGMNDDSASQQLFGSRGYDESGEGASSAGLELLCP